jgi:hypothetical protein
MSTTEKTLSAAELASIVAEALKGKSVRATALKAGDSYIAATWTQPKRYAEVTFIGFGRSKDALSAGIPQLKTLTALDKFYLLIGGEEVVADGRTAGNVFVGEGAGHRITFFERLVSTAPVIEAPVESDSLVETVIEDMIGEGLLPAEGTLETETAAHGGDDVTGEGAGEVVAEAEVVIKETKAQRKARKAAEAAAAIEAQIAEATA